jgi:hypothetical protein
MEEYFKTHPEEKKAIIKSVNDNNVKIKASVASLPSYLINENNDNYIAAVRINLII